MTRTRTTLAALALLAIGCGDPGTGVDPGSDYGTLVECNTVDYGIGTDLFIVHYWEVLPATPGDVFRITYCGRHNKVLFPGTETDEYDPNCYTEDITADTDQVYVGCKENTYTPPRNLVEDSWDEVYVLPVAP